MSQVGWAKCHPRFNKGTKLSRHFAHYQWDTVWGNGGQRFAFAHPTWLNTEMIRKSFNVNKDKWFRNESQKEAVQYIVQDRLADETYQEECRYLMRFWWHLSMGYQEVSYVELKSKLSENKMSILEELFDAIDSSYKDIDEWVEKYSSILPSLENRSDDKIS